MKKLTKEALKYLKILQFSDNEISQIGSKGNLSSLQIDNQRQKCVSNLSVFAEEVMKRLTATKIHKGIRYILGEVLLKIDDELDLDSIGPVQFDCYDEDFNTALHGVDGVKENVIELLDMIFEAAGDTLANLCRNNEIYSAEKDNSEIQMPKFKVGGRVRKQIDSSLYPIMGRPTKMDLSTYSVTVGFYFDENASDINSVYGCTMDTMRSLDSYNELCEKSLLFEAPLDIMNAKNRLVSRAFTIGNSNCGSNKEKYNELDMTTGNREQIKRSVNLGFGVRHPIYSRADNCFVE